MESSLQWKKLCLGTMGGQFPGTEFINGIRFIDKTNFERGNKILFRIEIWASKKIKNNILNKLIEEMRKKIGFEKIIVKNIEL